MTRIVLRSAFISLAVLTSVAVAQDAYTFNLNTGVNLQGSTDAESATDLTFSTEAGVPYTHPYDAQKIGSDGESRQSITHVHTLI